MTRTTKPPPNPDPIEAAQEAHERALKANLALRDSDDGDEPTGRHDVQEVRVIIEPREPQVSFHDVDIPKSRAGAVGGIAGALLALASVGIAICKALGWL